MGENGVGSPHVDGMFLDDPGPSTSEHPMQEYTYTSGQIKSPLASEMGLFCELMWRYLCCPGRYITNMQAAATAIGMSASEVQALATATYSTVVELRQRLQSQSKMLWLNGVDNANPFPLVDNQVLHANCSVEAPFQW
eukprot:COSAG02_NODE_8015_length_2745_cov_2.602672_1_plen_138_part_00